jgi:hypothetical protein
MNAPKIMPTLKTMPMIVAKSMNIILLKNAAVNPVYHSYGPI